VTIVSLLYHSQLSTSARAKHHFCSIFLRGPGTNGPNSLQTQDLEQEFRSWDLQVAHKCFASLYGQIIVRMKFRSFITFFLLKYWKRLHLHLVRPTPRKTAAIQHCFARYNFSLPTYRQLSILEMEIFNFPCLRGAKSCQEPRGGGDSASLLPRHTVAEIPCMPFCTGEEI